jgi:hypothetical protein
MQTTGPLMLVNLYKTYPEKESIYLIPEEYISPLTSDECIRYLHGERSKQLQRKLANIYALHYFSNSWFSGLMKDTNVR